MDTRQRCHVRLTHTHTHHDFRLASPLGPPFRPSHGLFPLAGPSRRACTQAHTRSAQGNSHTRFIRPWQCPTRRCQESPVLAAQRLDLPGRGWRLLELSRKPLAVRGRLLATPPLPRAAPATGKGRSAPRTYLEPGALPAATTSLGGGTYLGGTLGIS